MKPKDINLNVPVGDDPNKNADAQAMARAERDAFEAKRGDVAGWLHPARLWSCLSLKAFTVVCPKRSNSVWWEW